MAVHVGVDTTEVIDGRAWTFGRWTRAVWRDVLAEVRKDMPNPIHDLLAQINEVNKQDAQFLRELIAQDIAEEMAAQTEKRPAVALAPRYQSAATSIIREALQQARTAISPDSVEFQSWSKTPIGVSYILWCLLRQNHKDVTLDQAYEIMMLITDKIANIITRSTGVVRDQGKNESPATAST